MHIIAEESENYSLFYNKRSRIPGRCPRSDADMFTDDYIPAGLTYFSKVRLNLHTLTVIEDDYTFTRSSGRNQPFGSAGDCYSDTQGKCVQGHFSINFAGTKFRIRPATQWDTRNSTMIFSQKVTDFFF